MQGSTYDVLESEKIRTKITICNELLQLYAKFHPGYNYSSAMLHYEAALAIQGPEQSGSLYDQLKQFVTGLKEAMM